MKVVKANEQDVKIVDFGIESTKEEMSVSQFMERLDVFKFNDPIQRNCVWNIKKKSLLILSILQNVPIGQVMAQVIRKNQKKYRNILDGKQRLTTIRDFVKGKFALEGVDYLQGVDENDESILIDVNGLKFEELPKAFQDRIMSLILEIKAFEVGDDLKPILFYRWNNGEALKTGEKRKAKMDQGLLEFVARVKESKVFTSGLSDSAINRDLHGELVLQCMAVMISNGDTAIDGKTLDTLVAEGAFTEEIRNQFELVVQYLEQTGLEETDAKKVFTRNKLSSMIPATLQAMKRGINPETFGEWLNQVFNVEWKGSKLSSHSTSGTAKKESVKKRTQITLELFQEHFGLATEKEAV